MTKRTIDFQINDTETASENCSIILNNSANSRKTKMMEDRTLAAQKYVKKEKSQHTVFNLKVQPHVEKQDKSLSNDTSFSELNDNKNTLCYEEKGTANGCGKKRKLNEIETEQNGQIHLSVKSDLHNIKSIDKEQLKRLRRKCFRCGGRNHIVLVCTSTERDAFKNTSLPKCEECEGRGHSSINCPSIRNANPCYKCRRPGHFARDCPTNWIMRNMSYAGVNNPPEMSDFVRDQLQYYGYSSPEHFYSVLSAATNSGIYDNVDPRLMYSSSKLQPHNDFNQVNQSNQSGIYQNLGSQFVLPRNNNVSMTGKCFRCGILGHWTRDCPMRPGDSDPNGCYKCGKVGHKARECTACYRCGENGHRASECKETFIMNK